MAELTTTTTAAEDSAKTPVNVARRCGTAERGGDNPPSTSYPKDLTPAVLDEISLYLAVTMALRSTQRALAAFEAAQFVTSE